MATAFTDIHSDEAVAGLAAEIVTEGFAGAGSEPFSSEPAYEALVKAGSELWLDTGAADAARKVWAKELRGLTTNNTLINQVVQTGLVDSTVGTIAQRLKDGFPDMLENDRIQEAAFILNARIALNLVETFGTKVSVELHPDFSHDWRTSVAFGKRYFALNPDHFIIKVPMTPDGFVAVRKLSDEGIPVNFTLGFSARQNYFAARFSRPQYVNVFLGRLSVMLKENDFASNDTAGEFVTLRSQEAIEGLRKSHNSPTRQIAASIRSGEQVESLAGVDVLTIPPKAAGEYLERGTYKTSPITRHSSSEFAVQLTCDDQTKVHLSRLWDIPDEFCAFTDAAVKQVDSITEGYQIIELAAEHGVKDFFRVWPEEDLREIRAQGKQPKYDHWRGCTAADEMMSVGALQAFAVDQEDLDSRILRLMGPA